MHGNVKVGKVQGPDGHYDIRFNTKTATFSVGLPGKTVEGKDFEKLKADAEAWLSGSRDLDWSPVIAVKIEDYLGSDRSIVLGFERYFRAERQDEIYWKYFHTKGDMKSEAKGTPGENSRGPDHDAQILEYSPERWKAIRAFGDLLESLNARLRSEFGKDFTKFLDSVVEHGIESVISFKRGKP